jgi:probable phosphoglycerate mutase
MIEFHDLVLSRHGQTAWNLIGRRQGQLDSPLTPTGIAGARSLAATLANRGIDVIVTSPLGRAQQTAAIFANELGIRVLVERSLTEIDHGECAGLTNAEILHRFPEQWGARDLDFYRWRFPGGESYEDADSRAAVALAAINDLGAALPLLVTHEMIGRMLRRHLFDLTPEQAFELNHPHDVAYLLRDGHAHELRPNQVELEPRS